MTTLYDNINRIEGAKEALRQSILSKGIDVPASTKLSQYSEKILAIQVETEANVDLTGTGWETEPSFQVIMSRTDYLEKDLDNTRKAYDKFDKASTDAGNLYRYNKELVYAPKIDSGKVTSMRGIFSECSNLEQVPKFDTSSVQNFSTAFEYCKRLKSIPHLDTSSALITSHMFFSCAGLEFVPPMDLGQASEVNHMFAGCTSLKNISSLNTAKATNLNHMFYGCTSLVNAPNMNITKGEDLEGMFRDCANLVYVPDYETASATNMQYMFNNCLSLKNAPKLRTENVTSLFHMFSGCSKLEYVPLMDLGKARKSEISSLFADCIELRYLDGFPNLKISLNLSACNKLVKKSLLNVINNLGQADPAFEPNPVLTLSPQSKQQLNPQDIQIAAKKGWTIQ